MALQSRFLHSATRPHLRHSCVALSEAIKEAFLEIFFSFFDLQ
jgi:hypothetical protein